MSILQERPPVEFGREIGVPSDEEQEPFLRVVARRRATSRSVSGRSRTFKRYDGASVDLGAMEWHAVTASDWEATMVFERVTVDPDRMGGAPCIRDLRVPVATVVAMVADGMTVDEILADLPYLEREDITEALRFAAEAVRERELPLRQSA